MSNRAVIYVSGESEDDIELQMRQCQALCIERGYEVVAVAQEKPGSTTAWEDAHRMVREGEADHIVIATTAAVPDMLESATGGIHRAGDRRRPELRRTRPVPRDGGA